MNGVSFTKGCYVGQEVVSRMEHRGTARNRILPVKLEGAAPAKGTPIHGRRKADRHDAVIGGRSRAGALAARPAGGCGREPVTGC